MNRIIVDNVNLSGMISQRVLNIPQYLPHHYLLERIKKIKHRWFWWNRVESSIDTDGFQVFAFLAFTPIVTDIFLSNLVEFV